MTELDNAFPNPPSTRPATDALQDGLESLHRENDRNGSRSSLGPGPPPYVDYDPADYIIRPCTRCTFWWAEVVRQDTGMQVVREWHSPDCPVATEWQ